jgi:protein-S-isoprenylcysteine O-methyltransferase Ste14
MRDFAARGGWWVVAQGLLLAWIGTSWALWGHGWGTGAVAGGAVLSGLGAALMAGGFAALGSRISPFPVPLAETTLVEHGAYRLVRHPIYGGIVMAAAGVSLADGNWPGLAAAGALGLLFWGKSGFEENRLVARFPSYAAYRGRVRRRLVPWVV